MLGCDWMVISCGRMGIFCGWMGLSHHNLSTFALYFMLLFYPTLRSDRCIMGSDRYMMRSDSYFLRLDAGPHRIFNFTFFLFLNSCQQHPFDSLWDLYIQQALTMVAAKEIYSEVLQVKLVPRGGDNVDDDDQPLVLQVAAPNPILDVAITKAKCPLCSCMFSSLRRIISAPLEYRNIHLRRQLIIMMANHREFFFNLLKEHIRGTYGLPRQDEDEYQQRYRDGVLTDQEVQDHNCPGPFSFHSHLMALPSPNMWGDEQVLCLCSMMWQIGLRVVSAESFTQIRFRHKSSLERADGVLVMCLGQHYVPAHKYLSLFIVIAPVYSHCTRMWLDGYIMCSDGYIWQLDGCSTVPPS